uniref:(California timema) hypothetical protein n=1 Tax=Timema californicum TaxID=61474 RepID=A0A7R9JAF7_TIMCA|nr:unnamed protein product [Timema californicum]
MRSKAKSCITFKKDDVFVRVGSTKWKQGGKKYDIQEIFPHSKYNRTTMKNDIALIKIKLPWCFNDVFQYILFKRACYEVLRDASVMPVHYECTSFAQSLVDSVRWCFNDVFQYILFKRGCSKVLRDASVMPILYEFTSFKQSPVDSDVLPPVTCLQLYRECKACLSFHELVSSQITSLASTPSADKYQTNMGVGTLCTSAPTIFTQALLRFRGDHKDYIKSDEIYVRVGSTDWNQGGQVYDVDDHFLHPKFKLYGRKDIAIIKEKPPPVHPTEIGTSISPSSAVELKHDKRASQLRHRALGEHGSLYKSSICKRPPRIVGGKNVSIKEFPFMIFDDFVP